MGKESKKLSPKSQAWVDARKRHHLSHAQIQMARALGMNPAKLGKLDNHKQETWKLPLPKLIEELHLRRFGRTAPGTTISLEEQARIEQQLEERGRADGKQRAPETL